MYTIVIRWNLNWNYNEDLANDRTASIIHPELRARYQQFVDAGLVSNTFGPNCRIEQLEDCIEVRNSTWATFEAAQEWANLTRNVVHVIDIKILDESDNVLVTIPE